MTGMARSSQGLDERRRRLLYRCWHRGTRETDLIMGPFADAWIGELSDIELADFERLSDVPDPEIYAWVTGEAGCSGATRHAAVPTALRLSQQRTLT